MMSQRVVAEAVGPDYRQPAPQIVSSRLSVADERRRDVLGLSCGRAVPLVRPQEAMLAGRRLPTLSQRSAVTKSSVGARCS